MNIFKKLYIFLGSVQLAVTLIAISALFIIAGTWIESINQSHLSAANLIYHNPVFKLLLIFFFANILVSALQRWPFRYKHIPFLITHLGLLMIIAGVFIKNVYGVQGSMDIAEGSGSHTFFIPDTYALYVEKREPSQSATYELKRKLFGNLEIESSEDLQIELLGYAPNSSEKVQAWIHGKQGIISGLKPFQVKDWQEGDTLSHSAQVRLHHAASTPWRIYAFHTSNVSDLAQEIYLHSMVVALSHSDDDQIIQHCTLKEALQNPVEWKKGSAQFTLNLQSSPYLQVEGSQDQAPFKIHLDLAGPNSLFNQNKLNPTFGKAPIAVDLVCQPSLSFIEDDKGDIYFYAFDSNGAVHSQVYNGVEKMVLYDKGFGGYYATVDIPFSNLPNMRKEKEAARLHDAAVQLREALLSNPDLSPPLRVFLNVSQKTGHDFASNLLLFLEEWNRRNGWLFYKEDELSPTLQEILNSIDWPSVKDFKACYWLSKLCEEIELQGSLPSFLQEKGWIAKAGNKSELMESLTQSVYTLSDELPEVKEPIQSATLFSAYLRLYSIHLSHLKQNAGHEVSYFAAHLLAKKLNNALAPLSSPREYIELISELPENAKTLSEVRKICQSLLDNPTASKEEIIRLIQLNLPVVEQEYTIKSLETDLNAPQMVTLESPMKWVYGDHPSLPKLEDNCSLIKLRLKKDENEEIITLRHQAIPSGLKHPVLKGEYVVRFQPSTKEIPYHLRLRNARQIYYAQSSQTYSFECDLTVNGRDKGTPQNVLLSMNNVYETWDGYRFYLANMTPAGDSRAKHVQIVVNYDPAKYILTYPGAMILSIGILLLFWMNPYRKNGGN